jgi:predicted peptidase
MKKSIMLFMLVFILLTACAPMVENDNITMPTEDAIVTQPSTETEDPTELQTENYVDIIDITFSYEYISDGFVMPYGLFIPSVADSVCELPLIVWLHGTGELNCNENWFSSVGLPGVLNDWQLDGFGAYVVCPHLYGKWNPGYWNNLHTTENVMNLIDDIASKHNIDTDNIIICGYSLGGLGAMYMAYHYPEYFNKMVIMSSLCLGNYDLSEIKIPTIGCVESSQSVWHFMNNEFASVFGNENVWHYEATHSQIPFVAFTEDKDGDGRSDLIAWMLS